MADIFSALAKRKNPYLEALLREGLSSAPVQSHWQGVSRLAHGLLAGAELRDQDRRALAPGEAQGAAAGAEGASAEEAGAPEASSEPPAAGETGRDPGDGSQAATFNDRFGQQAQNHRTEDIARAWFTDEGGMNERRDPWGASAAQYRQASPQAAWPPPQPGVPLPRPRPTLTPQQRIDPRGLTRQRRDRDPSRHW